MDEQWKRKAGDAAIHTTGELCPSRDVFREKQRMLRGEAAGKQAVFRKKISIRWSARHQDASVSTWDLQRPPEQRTGKQANASFGSVTSRSGRCSSQHDTGRPGAAKNMGRVNTGAHRGTKPPLNKTQRLHFLFTVRKDQEASLPWYTSTFEM